MIPLKFSYKDIISIGCRIHGTFNQKARTHVAGSGCPACAQEVREQTIYKRNRHSKDQFILKAQATHGNKYDYTKSVYIGQMKQLTITCPIHGDFQQIANNHIHGNGCSQCSDSRGEREICNILNKLGIEFIQQKTFPDCKNFNRKKPKVLPFDFYLPNHNILIEFDGKHHFEPVRFNGVSHQQATILHNQTIENDHIKNDFAKNNNIPLIRVPHFNQQDLIETLCDIIRNTSNSTSKIKNSNRI